MDKVLQKTFSMSQKIAHCDVFKILIDAREVFKVHYVMMRTLESDFADLQYDM